MAHSSSKNVALQSFMNQLKIANSKPAQDQQLAIDDTLGGPTRKESSLTHITVTA
jgi:hypothetical protein